MCMAPFRLLVWQWILLVLLHLKADAALMSTLKCRLSAIPVTTLVIKSAQISSGSIYRTYVAGVLASELVHYSLLATLSLKFCRLVDSDAQYCISYIPWWVPDWCHFYPMAWHATLLLLWMLVYWCFPVITHYIRIHLSLKPIGPDSHPRLIRLLLACHCLVFNCKHCTGLLNNPQDSVLHIKSTTALKLVLTRAPGLMAANC